MHSFADIRDLLMGTWKDFNEDKAPRLAAALAYFTIFSLAPLLVIAISIAGIFFGEEAARGALSGQLNSLLGAQGAEAVEQMLAASANEDRAGIFATVVGIITLIFGAAGVFGQLQDALNTIWEVAPKPNQGIWGFIRARFLSFAMVLGTGFMLLVSLLLSTTLAAVGQAVGGEAYAQSIIGQVINFVVQLVVTFGLFTAIFKLLPDAKIAWRDVLLGAGITTVLFAVGRFLIDLYLSTTGTGSTYGAIGSLIVLLIWIFYSAQILFFGAEFTQVYAQRFGSRIRPSDNAVPVTEEARAQQGMPDPKAVAATARQMDGEPPRERAVGEPPRERVVGETRGAYAPSDRAAPAQPDEPARKSSSGATVLAGATIFATLSAIARGLKRRR